MVADGGGMRFKVGGTISALFKIMSQCRVLQGYLVPSTLTSSNANFDKMNDEINEIVKIINDAIYELPGYQQEMERINASARNGNL